MENPFKFENPNKPRLVTNHTMDWNKLYGMSTGLWALSVSMYIKNFFRVNNNAVYLMAFTAMSAPASYGYVKYAMSSSLSEAAYLNNREEGA